MYRSEVSPSFSTNSSLALKCPVTVYYKESIKYDDICFCWLYRFSRRHETRAHIRHKWVFSFVARRLAQQQHSVSYRRVSVVFHSFLIVHVVIAVVLTMPAQFTGRPDTQQLAYTHSYAYDSWKHNSQCDFALSEDVFCPSSYLANFCSLVMPIFWLFLARFIRGVKSVELLKPRPPASVRQHSFSDFNEIWCVSK